MMKRQILFCAEEGERTGGLTFRRRNFESRELIVRRKKKSLKSVFVRDARWTIVMESKKLTAVCLRLI
jgi:hypothetical protein